MVYVIVLQENSCRTVSGHFGVIRGFLSILCDTLPRF